MNVLEYNRAAWDANVANRNQWTVPVDAKTIQRARNGDWSIVLTPLRPVPSDWFPDLQGLPTLCLASGGGQQGPVLAAAGAAVTVFDNSPRQLGQDHMVAEREGLDLKLIRGDMRDLSKFDDGQFQLIVHPVSNCFAPEILPVWRECFRILQPGGILLSGFTNPVRYIFDDERAENGRLEVRYSIPYSDLDDLTDEQRQALVIARNSPLEFGHTLEDQIGGQIKAGFSITGFLEDSYDRGDLLSKFISTFILTRAQKPLNLMR
ncbi:MAG: methyltransferase domain-containing protein [Planctomycetota bacterium]|nr:methyltransferase domain-containing protein [Planctomycetota bacterium]